ncbi:MAG: DinB family protein [Candidatus Hodarchaeales archaeon]|jgi:hypothetical protein
MTHQIEPLISEIKDFPIKLRELIERFSDLQLDQKLENWSTREIIHHLADTHTVIYFRIKQILTNEPIFVKPVNNQNWSRLVDYASSVSNSLNIILGIHERLTFILENLTSEEWLKTFNHPERGSISFESYIKTLVDHGNYHFKKIEAFSKNII